VVGCQVLIPNSEVPRLVNDTAFAHEVRRLHLFTQCPVPAGSLSNPPCRQVVAPLRDYKRIVRTVGVGNNPDQAFDQKFMESDFFTATEHIRDALRDHGLSDTQVRLEGYPSEITGQGC
jgi:hypothetical protein